MKQQEKKRFSAITGKVGEAEDITPKGEPLGEYLEKIRQLRTAHSGSAGKAGRCEHLNACSHEGGEHKYYAPKGGSAAAARDSVADSG